MRLPWETRKELRERITGLRSIIDAQERSLDQTHLHVETTLDENNRRHKEIQKLMQAQIDYWKRTAETLLDREAVRTSGVPIYRQAPVPGEPEEQPEPTSEGLQAMDDAELPPEGIPRVAMLRNPRLHTRHVTAARTVDHNRRTMENGVRAAREQMAAIDKQLEEQVKKKFPVPEVG